MTTTDPTPLPEQIAREHAHLAGIGECRCSTAIAVEGCGSRRDPYAAHIATVTEQAVRERVAALLNHEAGLDMEAHGERDPGNRRPLSTPISRRLRHIARDIATGAPDA